MCNIFVGSVHAAQTFSVAKVEQALSELAPSSICSSMKRPLNTQNAWTMQHKIWLLLAKIYIVQDLPAYALNCLQEAINIFPLSHHIMYMVSNI